MVPIVLQIGQQRPACVAQYAPGEPQRLRRFVRLMIAAVPVPTVQGHRRAVHERRADPVELPIRADDA